MEYNSEADIALVAGLDENYSEQEILKVIKILEKRLRANHDARFKLIAEIDETVIKDTVNKLQSIFKSKDMDLKIDTYLKEEIAAIMFGNDTISKKRIAIRKMKKRGLSKNYITLFLKLLEYISEV